MDDIEDAKLIAEIRRSPLGRNSMIARAMDSFEARIIAMGKKNGPSSKEPEEPKLGRSLKQFDRKAYQRSYMPAYMRKWRARPERGRHKDGTG